MITDRSVLRQRAEGLYLFLTVAAGEVSSGIPHFTDKEIDSRNQLGGWKFRQTPNPTRLTSLCVLFVGDG